MRRTLTLLTLIAASNPACKSAPEPTASALVTPPPPVEPEPEPTPEWVTGAWPTHLPQGQFAAAVATSTDAATARAKAEAALEVRLLGPEERRPFDEVPERLQPLVDDASTRVHTEDGVTSVLVATPRDAVLARLEAWTKSLEPKAPLPERTASGERLIVSGTDIEDPRAHLASLVAHAHHRRAARFACTGAPVRTSTLAHADSCDVPAPDLVRRALGDMLDAVVITSEPAGGVPLHPRTGALRPVTLRVTWTSPGAPPAAMRDMPVTLDLWGTTVTARTDAEGRVRAPVPDVAAPDRAAEARIDAEALLGGLADQWTDVPKAQVILRALTPNRMQLGMRLTETSAGRPTVDGTERLRESLRAEGLGVAFYLDESLPLAQPIQAAEVRALADLAQGRLDVLAVGHFDSHFASQMGARSVWYEATGHVELFDAWTGQRIETFDDAARAVAIGEAAAARAAVRGLGEQLAKKLYEALVAYAPPAMAHAR